MTCRCARNVAAVVCFVFLAGAVSCRSSHTNDVAPRRSLSLDEFFIKDSTADSPLDMTDVSRASDTVVSDIEQSEPESTDAHNRTTADSGVQPASTTPPSPVRLSLGPAGEVTVIGALVGHVYGRPVFADDFLGDMAARLYQEAREQRALDASQNIARVYRDSIVGFRGSTNSFTTYARDIAFQAQAQAAIPRETQVGLFRFFQELREQEIAQRGGFQQSAEELLQQDSEDVESIEELVRQKVDDEVLQLHLRNIIGKRVFVSWRDIERGYRRNLDAYVSSGSIVLAYIRLSVDEDQDTIRTVEERLATGDDFMQVAQDVGMSESRLHQEYVLDGDGNVQGVRSQWQAACKELNEGEFAEPFVQNTPTSGPVQIWLYVKSKKPPVTRSLYDRDVQEELYRYIYESKLEAELQRYFDKILPRDMLREMEEQLIIIALNRYAR